MRNIIYSCIVLLFLSCNSENANKMLEVAVENGDIELMREALSKGANPDEAIVYDVPVLCDLVSECSMEAIQLLLREGASPNLDCDGEPMLMTALDCEYFPLIEMLLNAGADIDAQDEFGITTLAWSINNEQVNIFKYLIQKGASMEIRDSSGFHPVVYAPNLKILKILEQLDFPLDVVSTNGTTFLMDAVDTGSDDIIEYLITEKKVDIHAKNQEGLTAYDFLNPEDSTTKVLLDKYY